MDIQFLVFFFLQHLLLSAERSSGFSFVSLPFLSSHAGPSWRVSGETFLAGLHPEVPGRPR